MKTTAATLSMLALAIRVFAAPTEAGAPAKVAAPAELSKRESAEVLLCSNSFRGGNCILWTMKTGHFWGFDDNNLAAVRNGLSSIYPQDGNHKWTICNALNGGGVCLRNIVAPGIDNLADFNFNDQAWSIAVDVL